MFPRPGEPCGALLPMGGHKGNALSMVCEVIGAALIGGSTGREATMTAQHAVYNNMLTLLFDPSRLAEAPMFAQEVGALVEWVKSSPPRPGMDPIQVPGDPERASRAARAARMPVDGGTLAALDEAAAKVHRETGHHVDAASALIRAA
jgi:uncharacterized oxidoreductase